MRKSCEYYSQKKTHSTKGDEKKIIDKMCNLL